MLLPQTPRGTAWSLGCSSLLSIYVHVFVCVCASVSHGSVDVSLQQIYLPVHLCVMMLAYECTCATLYAIWSMGVSFFSICSSHLWRKADPLWWMGSKVIWRNICQLGIQMFLLQSQIAFHTIGGRLSVLYSYLCVYCGVGAWLDWCCYLLPSPTRLRRLTHTLTTCLCETKQTHISGFCVVHTQC